jgi:hypothetical protein
MCVFNFRFFGILEICFLKTKSTGAHVPKAFSVSTASTWHQLLLILPQDLFSPLFFSIDSFPIFAHILWLVDCY